MTGETGFQDLAITPRFYYSNFNLDPLRAPFIGLDGLERAMDQLEDGDRGSVFEGQYEFTPTRKLALEAYAGKFAGRRALGDRVHQTWAPTLLTGLRTAKSVKGKLFDLASYAAMPDVSSSLKTIRRINEQLGGVVLCGYLHRPGPGGAPVADFREYAAVSGVQIQPNALDAADARGNFRNFHDLLWKRGMIGVIYDNHHALSEGLPKDGTIGAMRATGTFVLGIHFAAGRVDARTRTDQERSMQDLAAVFGGPDAIAATTLGKVTAAAYRLACEQRRNDGSLPKARYEETVPNRLAIIEHHKQPDGSADWRGIFRDLAAEPAEAAIRHESRSVQGYLAIPLQRRTVPVTIEIPHAGLSRYRQGTGRGKRMSKADFASMTRDAATSIRGFFAGIAGLQ